MKFLMLFLLVFMGCSDSERGAIGALGKSRHVKCYSGGNLIYEGRTTGKISNEQDSDGYYFMDTDGQFIEINAECIFTK